VTRFLLQRLAETLLVLLVMSFVIYGLIGLMPGDPIDLMLTADPKLTPADVARLKALQGLDQPLIDRYLAWLAAALQGDFGYSRLQALPVWQVIMPRLGNTVLLMGLSLAIALAIAVPAGVWAAARPGSLADGAINLLAFAGLSVPLFWLAILLIILFAVILRVLPASGTATVGADGLADRATYLVLPVLTLTIVTVGTQLRYIRAAMIEVLRQDFIRTARAKGVARGRLLYGHALRNAMIPFITILALDFGTLFSGALVTETMFAYLGMGKLIYDSIMGNDFNVALVGLLFATLLTLASNLGADVVYAWLDPRISYES
jgi:peptide/nickel transport system permease protein